LLKNLFSLIILFFFILSCQIDALAAEKKISKTNSSKKTASKNIVKTTPFTKGQKCVSKKIKTIKKPYAAKEKSHNDVVKTGQITSKSYLIFDAADNKSYVSKYTEKTMPIASVTKLMSAMVLLDAGLSMDEQIEITNDDIDTIKNSNSRLEVGFVLSRKELLNMSLMSSENRATFSLARTYPGGKKVFVREMNRKAKELGMFDSVFVDPTGLSENNVSTATDLLKMVNAANKYFLIRHYSTTAEKNFEVNGKILTYKNSNYLVREGNWDINLSKTGFINEAGKCLVMHTKIANHPVIVILLGSSSGKSRIDDAEKLRDIYLAKTHGKV
jgi:D-alanyl-D-alanine endopeptidase (penicillin-binding protein 7)